jgi:sulfofructosephosphate aldolase
MIFPPPSNGLAVKVPSGFLAGRAVWRGVIGQPDIRRALREDALPRLRRLCDVVDRVVMQT